VRRTAGRAFRHGQRQFRLGGRALADRFEPPKRWLRSRRPRTAGVEKAHGISGKLAGLQTASPGD
jgi:hypothetical protein